MGICHHWPQITLDMGSTSERRRYTVTPSVSPSLTGWAYSQNDPCCQHNNGSSWSHMCWRDFGYMTEYWDGNCQVNFLRNIIFPIFQNFQDKGYLLNITLIFERCQCSSAVMIPIKCGCDLKDLTSTNTKSEISLTEKLANKTLSNSNPWESSPSAWAGL